jgi:tripartite-type tricarboxylate transporter receptor subunit TctC
VAGLGGYVFGLAVSSTTPYRTLDNLLGFARTHPGEVTYGHAGVGSTPHLAVEELALKTGVQLTAVPYKGSNEALAALLGGRCR